MVQVLEGQTFQGGQTYQTLLEHLEESLLLLESPDTNLEDLLHFGHQYLSLPAVPLWLLTKERLAVQVRQMHPMASCYAMAIQGSLLVLVVQVARESLGGPDRLSRLSRPDFLGVPHHLYHLSRPVLLGGPQNLRHLRCQAPLVVPWVRCRPWDLVVQQGPERQELQGCQQFREVQDDREGQGGQERQGVQEHQADQGRRADQDVQADQGHQDVQEHQGEEEHQELWEQLWIVALVSEVALACLQLNLKGYVELQRSEAVFWLLRLRCVALLEHLPH